MSALAMQLREHYALIATDGVELEKRSGVIKCVRSPIVCLPHFNALLAVAGVRGMPEFISMHTPPHITDYDGLLQALPSMVSSAMRTARTKQLGLEDRLPTSIVLVGWSNAAQRFVAHQATLDTRAKGDASDLVKMTAILTDDVWRNFSLTSKARSHVGLNRETGDDDINQLIRHVFASSVQYAMRPTWAANDAPVAGGFIKLAAVSRDNQKVWIAHRWDGDHAGATLDPSLNEELPRNIPDAEISF